MNWLFTARWKKRLRWLGAGFTLFAAILLTTLFFRFNFGQRQISSLGKLQRACGIHQPENPQVNVTPLIIGHRGVGLRNTKGDGYVGNTMKAITRAIDAKPDWIEIDIRKSSDGTMMVFHDKDLHRTTGASGNFDSLTKAQLQKLKLNVNPVESIPTFKEVLEKFADPNIHFILDIKVAGLKDQLLPLIDEYLAPEQVLLFGTYSILQEYEDAGYALGYTALFSEGANRYRFLLGHQFLLDRCRNLECDYLVLPAIFLHQSLIEESKSNGVEIWAYDVGEKDWEDVIHRGVAGLIVDRAAFAKQRLASP